MIFVTIATAQKKVAVLVPYDEENKVSKMYKLMIRTTLTREISNANNYIALDMANVDAVIDQVKFQNTGLVLDEERQQLGIRYGAEYICRSELFTENNYVTISASIIAIETGEVVPGKTDYVYTKLDPDNIDKACKELSEKLFGNNNNYNGNSGTFTDNRDSKQYKWVKIGNQTWMAENLAYEANSGYWAYNDNQSYVAKYGYLYNWETATNVCPNGWHLPTDDEWAQLEHTLGGSKIAGGKLKSTNTWESPNTGATNSSGFLALSGSYRNYDGTFNYVGRCGVWWSATARVNSRAWIRTLDNNSAEFYRLDINKSYGYSVRCLKD